MCVCVCVGGGGGMCVCVGGGWGFGSGLEYRHYLTVRNRLFQGGWVSVWEGVRGEEVVCVWTRRWSLPHHAYLIAARLVVRCVCGGGLSVAGQHIVIGRDK